MSEKVHHINFLVRDLDAAIPVWEQVLNKTVDARDRLESRGVDIARFDIGGCWVSLVQPTKDGTIPAEHLARHGEGFFLMSVEVDSLDAEIDRLGENKFDGPIRTGLDSWRVRDIDAALTFGAQIQLVEDQDHDN